MKKVGKLFAILLGVALAVVLAYVAYVFVTYKRIEDKQVLEVRAGTSASLPKVQTGRVYGAVSYNAGFGAYLPEFSFFMDGGTESRAKDEESVLYSIKGGAALLHSYEPDFLFLFVDLYT